MSKRSYEKVNRALNFCAFTDWMESQQRKLPKLSDVEQLSPRVIRIMGQNPGKFTLQGTNTYIVGTGSERLIIDTAQGHRAWADLVQVVLDEECARLSRVLLTHWHGDHTGGVPDLIQADPELSAHIYKHSPDEGQQPLQDGQIIRVEGATIRCVFTPGHAYDHMCFVLDEEDALFTGDNVLGHGTTAIEDLGQFTRSLRKMQDQGCEIGYPAHGEVIQDLPAKISKELAAKTRREKQTLSALQSAETKMADTGEASHGVTVQKLVSMMYGEDLDPVLRKSALEPFLEEVLEKLVDDEKVGKQEVEGVKRWHAIEA